MLGLSSSFFWVVSYLFFRSRHDLGLELVALLQQLGVLKRKNPRPRIGRLGSAVFGRLATVLVEVGGSADCRETRDGRELASCRVSPLLALSFPARSGS